MLIDQWTYGGHLIPERYRGRRLGWCDLWVRDAETSNPYAHPISGLKLIVDMNTMELLEIENHPNAGFPAVQGEYLPEHVPGYREREGRTPLEITQPDGPSFTLEGNLIRWQNWELRAGFNYREGPGAAPHRLARRRPAAPGGAPDLVRRDGGALPGPDARPRPAHRLRHRRVGPGRDDHLAGAGLRLPGRDPLPGRGAAGHRR